LTHPMILCVGNRISAIETLYNAGYSVQVFAQRGSILEKFCAENTIQYRLMPSKSSQFISVLTELEFDVLISAGCPFIIPVSQMSGKALFTNLHPTLLPDLQGKTPLNGVFMLNRKYIGATFHYMNDQIDAGNIIYQTKTELSDDMDLGLVYYVSFELEKIAFRRGWKLLQESEFTYCGKPQQGPSTYFNRTAEMMEADITSITVNELLLKVKAFGIRSQGVKLFRRGSFTGIVVFSASQIINSFLQDNFSDSNPGTVLLEYDRKLLVKVRDGLVRFDIFEYKEVK